MAFYVVCLFFLRHHEHRDNISDSNQLLFLYRHFFSFALINVLINNGTHFMWLRIKWTTAYIHTYTVIHRLTKMKQMPWVNLYYIPNAIWAILHGLRKFVSYLLTLLCASHIYKTEISNIRQFIRCMCVCNMYDRISVYKMKIRKSNLFINFMNCVIIWYKHKSNLTEFSGNSYLRCVLKITTFSHPMKWIYFQRGWPWQRFCVRHVPTVLKTNFHEI